MGSIQTGIPRDLGTQVMIEWGFAWMSSIVAYSHIKGIHYYTLKALVKGSGAENNSYAIVEVRRNRDVTVTGYRKAVGKTMAD